MLYLFTVRYFFIFSDSRKKTDFEIPQIEIDSQLSKFLVSWATELNWTLGKRIHL